MEIPAAVLDIIRIAAPTLGLALGGPLAGAAAALATKAIFGDGEPALKPEELVAKIDEKQKSNDPDIFANLVQAERNLRQYEAENNLKFAELEYKNLDSIREFQNQAHIETDVFSFGKRIVYAGYGSLLFLAIAVAMLMAGIFKLDNPIIITAGFSFISSVATAFIAWAVMVLSFYFGTSRSSEAKSRTIDAALQKSGNQLGEAATQAAKAAAERAAAERAVADRAAATAAAASAAAASLAKTTAQPPAAVNTVPAQNPPATGAVVASRGNPPPGPPSAAPPAVPQPWMAAPHGGGVRWMVTPDGVIVEGEHSPARSPGQPVTVRKAWEKFGAAMMAECLKQSVPVEIGMMVLCTESAGKLNQILIEPDGRTSSGLMQVLTGTASEVLGRTISIDDLQDMKTNFEAGVGYIRSQKQHTWFDPVLTAAAYNAGGIHPNRDEDNNRFNLRSTGDHLERAIRWYGDICFVSKTDGWFK